MNDPVIHAVVAAQFGDLEFDVGKSVRWTQWYTDHVHVTDVNLGTQRYWIIDWDKTFRNVKHDVTGINFFYNPAEFRKEQWALYKKAFTVTPTDWVLWVDAHEGLSFDTRTRPTDYAASPFRSWIYREVARAEAASQDRVVVPFYVFCRSSNIQNIQLLGTGSAENDVDDALQAVSVPYYYANQGLTRLFKASALDNPDFDWRILDTPVPIQTGPVGTGSSIRNITGAYIEGPDLASIAGATKLTVEVDVSMDDWTPASHGLLIGQVLSGNQSWYLLSASSGVPNFFAYLTSAGGPTTYTGPAYGFVDGSRHTLSATWTASNGANSTVQHKKDGANLGSLLTGPVFPSGLTNSPQKITIGREAVGANTVIGNFFGARIYANDVLVASPDFTSMVAGQTSVTDAQGNVWTLKGTAAVANPVPIGPTVKMQIISYAYAHWQMLDIEDEEVGVPPMTEANDFGFLQRKEISRVRPIAAFPYNVWNPTDDQSVGLPGPWCVDKVKSQVPGFGSSVVITAAVPPSDVTLAGILTPLYDQVFRLALRDGIWYQAGHYGSIPLSWDSAEGKWVTNYDPATWPEQGMESLV